MFIKFKNININIFFVSSTIFMRVITSCIKSVFIKKAYRFLKKQDLDIINFNSKCN